MSKETMKELMKALQLNTDIESYLEQLEEEIAKVIDKILEAKMAEFEKFIKEKAKPGLKGDKPILGVDYKIPDPIPGPPGKPGKDADETKITLDVLSRIPKPKDGIGKDGSPDTGEIIVDKINELPIDDPKKKIDASHIKNLPKGEQYRGIIRGGMEQIRPSNLSSQCDGVTTSFTLDRDAVAVILLASMQAPGIYNPATHFTFTAPRTIALTAEVSAPEAGQSLIAIIQTQ